jgi:hypothetical protein
MNLLRISHYGGVTVKGPYSYPRIYTVTFRLSVITTHLWKSVYSDYQQWLFDEIRSLKECNLTPIGYRKISQSLNERGVKSPTGKPFTNTMVSGIYSKGKLRIERINRNDEVCVSDFKVVVYQ